uniref:Uncharacterized protein n=1 Tax=Proboscia inermis TaxID=420281 RepID=A0A7S0GFB4_9STRA|mmetsp:Transcript_30166/g.30525  ORF Transcript_30166/g.30525 Transcript_30166/m.30525 type:complete len:215 (+) Transcript_30166:51-695(+)
MRLSLLCNVLVANIYFFSFALVEGFVPSSCHLPSSRHALVSNASQSNENENSVGRRTVLYLPILATLSPLSALADAEKIVKITEEEAVEKFREGYKSITYLLDHYDEICEGGGDNVRRYLGTVVSTKDPSGLVGIQKVMKALEDRADDFIEYTELSNEIMKSITQADGSAYMSIFVGSSTSYTPPKKYFDDAKIEVKRCVKSMSELGSMVGIKL